MFCVQNLCCNDSKYHSFNWKDVSVTKVDFFEKKQLSPVFYFLLQVYMLYRVSLTVVSFCTKGFAYLVCWPRGRGVGLTCTRRFSFHEFYNFLPFNFFFLENLILPTTFTHTHTHDPRPQTTTHDPRHLATLAGQGTDGSLLQYLLETKKPPLMPFEATTRPFIFYHRFCFPM